MLSKQPRNHLIGNLLGCLFLAGTLADASDDPPSMKIKFTFNDQTMIAKLEDNATSRDFIKQLPLALTFEDYARTEKIATPPRKLSREGAPAGVDPDVGDITYYAPWGNLAIFYKDFGYSNGLIKIGEFEGDITPWSHPETVEVLIETVD